ncbi:MAG TPA: cytochrome c oxidase assembly factor Coa1 family protein [Thermoanaerobaculia bacterium]|nr:cytochrome c oxidase assembly factor Coa1 family protein [Thermoanaerobaculia bacterium]
MTVTPPPPPTGTFPPPQGSYTPAPGAPPPPQKSGGCFKAVAIGCSIILVLGLAAILAIVVFVFGVIKRSDVYREAFTRSSNDPRVIAALGTPIEKGWWVKGNVNIDSNGGTANIDFPISGPKGKALVHAAATRESDAWKYSAITVKPDAGAEIDVLNP